MKSKSLCSTAIFALAIFSLPLDLSACDNRNLAVPLQPNEDVATGTAMFAADSVQPWHNVGTYRFDEAMNAFVLTASWFDPAVATQPFVLQHGDLVNPPFLPLPPSGGSPFPPGGGDQIQSDCTPILETIIVTASPPPSRMRLGFTRFFSIGEGGGLVNVLRPTVGLEYIEIQPQTLHCQSAREDRYGAVMEAIRGGDSTGFDVAGIFLVQYSPGHRQWWTCPNMQISTCGLLEGSACSSNPPRP